MQHDPAIRQRALDGLEVLVGAWTVEVAVPGGPVGQTVFEWTLDREFLTQRTDVPDPNVPNSLAIIAVADDASTRSTTSTREVWFASTRCTYVIVNGR